jgi:isoquinoline 1-oxidoreductase beta subunit
VAEVAEISRIGPTALRVHKVAVAIDCGMAVNPDQVRAQAEGGVAHGLAATLWGHVEFTNRRASVRNFSSYRLVRMREMPQVSVRIIESGIDHLGGIGEVAVPPIAPAVANAWFTLTGERVRQLPFFPGQSRMGDD